MSEVDTTPVTDPNDAAADTSQDGETSALGDAATAEEGSEPAVKPGEGEAPDFLGAPDDYDPAAFEMPEGVEFDGEMFDLVKDDLKGMNVSQKGAGQLLGMFTEKVIPKIQERQVAAIEEQGRELSADLARQLQSDPEVGGAKLKESQAFAAKAIASAIPDAALRAQFSEFLNESGLGNHPLLMRVISAGGRALSEGTTPAGETVTERSDAQKFYNRS